MPAIIISGTPGTGKSTLAKKLSKCLGFKHIDLNKLIKKKKLYEFYDRSKKCFVVDTKKLTKLAGAIKEKNIIIDSHLSHYLPPECVEMCIITKCNLKTLKKRLEKRGYSEKKVRENLDCEIFETCYTEALERGHNVVVYKNFANLIKEIKMFFR